MIADHDPVLTEVIRNELEALVDEMRIAIRKTAHSPMVKVGDFSVTLCDRKGRGIGLGETNGVHPLFYEMAPRVLKKYQNNIRPGDIFMLNDPFSGASHILDLFIIAPLFWNDQLAVFALVYSHHTDMGGRFPGGGSGAYMESYEEGLRIPLTKVVDAGRRNQEILDIILANVRDNDSFVGDIEAKITGCWRAGENIRLILDKYGLKEMDACCEYLNKRGEQAVRAAIRKIPPGEYDAQTLLTDNGFGPVQPGLPVRVTLRVAVDNLVCDFTGTHRQVRGGVNLPLGNLRGIVFLALKQLLHPDIPLNAGTMAPIEIVAPRGTLVNPEFPAATAGRAPMFFVVDEIVHRALAKAIPHDVPVPSEHWDILHFSKRTNDGGEISLLDLCSGGFGARPNSDGPDGIGGSPMVSLPVEMVERGFPLLIEGFGLVPDSAGPGKYRGSMAVFRRYRFLESGHAMVRTNRLSAPLGLAGGEPGLPSSNFYNPDSESRRLPQQLFNHFEPKPGDVLVHRIGGCGGHGNPRERDPEKVRKDVKEERLSIEAALLDYSVVINPETLEVDFDKTAHHRVLRGG